LTGHDGAESLKGEASARSPVSGDADGFPDEVIDEADGLVETPLHEDGDVEVTVWSAESEDPSDEDVLGQASDDVLQTTVEAWIEDME